MASYFIIIVSIYCALVLLLIFGFTRVTSRRQPAASHVAFISIVISFRNEAENIPNLLKDLAAIKYPADKWEVILVNDHSTDNFQVTANNVRVLHSSLPGKKAAITTAVEAAIGDIIATTDADCRVKPLWLEEINRGFQDPEIQMMIGGVRIEGDNSLFSKLQALEFVSVAATGAATLGLGFPTMCNGANLSYRRDAFIKIGGYQGNEKVSSGDDEYLMNKIHKTLQGSIGYLKSSDSFVTTAPRSDVAMFISQRLRWAGKWRSNISVSTQIFALVVWLFHVACIAIAVSAMFGFITWKLFVILAGTKIFVEALLLIPAANFFKVKWSWISFLVLQFVYSIYVITIGFMSQILLPRWKGRAVEAKV